MRVKKDIERLELIVIKTEKVKQNHPIMDDLKWAIKELRAAWLREEKRGKE